MPIAFGRKATRGQQARFGVKAPRSKQQAFGTKNTRMQSTVLGANGAGRPPVSVNPGRQIPIPETNF